MLELVPLDSLGRDPLRPESPPRAVAFAGVIAACHVAFNEVRPAGVCHAQFRAISQLNVHGLMTTLRPTS